MVKKVITFHFISIREESISWSRKLRPIELCLVWTEMVLLIRSPLPKILSEIFRDKRFFFEPNQNKKGFLLLVVFFSRDWVSQYQKVYFSSFSPGFIRGLDDGKTKPNRTVGHFFSTFDRTFFHTYRRSVEKPAESCIPLDQVFNRICEEYTNLVGA